MRIIYYQEFLAKTTVNLYHRRFCFACLVSFLYQVDQKVYSTPIS